jgi:hypothetical protein
MNHSNIVGGSTAKRVIACPASVQLVAKMPPKPSNEHADRGTLLHNVIAEALEFVKPLNTFIGATYEKQTLTQELLDEKLRPAIEALNEIDPNREMEYAVETRVGFGDFLPNVFGSTDLIGRIGNRAIVLDWKFGDGVMVEAEENDQLMFYAAAAMRTDSAKWAFDGAEEIELIIVQPPFTRRWVTTRARIEQFERDLARAVKVSAQSDATMKSGEHCRWCAAKPICPAMTGAVDRALKQQLVELDTPMLASYLKQADILEGWIKDLRALAFQVLESGSPMPGYKLVAKRATRQWTSDDAVDAWVDVNGIKDAYETKLKSPAQMEKLVKNIPDELVKRVSSGTTMAEDSDPRPAVLQIGQQLNAALSKLL